MSKHILIVDDEPNVRLSYRITLETEGYTVREADSAAKALEALAGDVVDIAILDLRMPGMDGLDLLAEMRNRGCRTPVVIITAYGSVPNAVRAMKLGALDFLAKPLTPEALRTTVSDVLMRPEVHAEPPNDNFESHLAQAKCLICLQNFDDAWPHLSKALELGKTPDAANLAGVFFEMQDDYQRARHHYARAIEIDASYEPARQNMRRLMEIACVGYTEESLNLGEPAAKATRQDAH